ncbi:hypothetical protein FSPOR_9147 [Fusarium sporotrichioides]|uniref:Uncharacterized protein n=1 Tax=Fusarium sporotrichioides TaxID=5514 RepID=A0A395RR02_FUSSP|nr:hypothetical protein FSPOR_9147 [Fusarium sporotrichioides]
MSQKHRSTEAICAAMGRVLATEPPSSETSREAAHEIVVPVGSIPRTNDLVIRPKFPASETLDDGQICQEGSERSQAFLGPAPSSRLDSTPSDLSPKQPDSGIDSNKLVGESSGQISSHDYRDQAFTDFMREHAIFDHLDQRVGKFKYAIAAQMMRPKCKKTDRRVFLQILKLYLDLCTLLLELKKPEGSN